jgi:hypothetical protein
MAIYLYEFLYRGQPPGSSAPPDFHVLLGDAQTDPFTQEPTLVVSSAMTPAQANTAGFSLEAIIGAINVGLTADVQRLTDQVATLTAQLAPKDDSLPGT